MDIQTTVRDSMVVLTSEGISCDEQARQSSALKTSLICPSPPFSVPYPSWTVTVRPRWRGASLCAKALPVHKENLESTNDLLFFHWSLSWQVPLINGIEVPLGHAIDK